MVQDQLVEYITSQLKTGVSREAVKASLIGAGWQAADVEDTLKKVEAPKVAAAPMASSPQAAGSPKPLTFSSASSTPPQTIKVSDLVSAPSSATSLSSFTGKAASMAASAGAKDKDIKKGSAAKSMDEFPPPKDRSGVLVYVISAVLVIGLGAFAAYLYLQNNSLAAKVASLGGASAGVTSNLSSLNAQVQALDASNTMLTMQVASVTAENQDLQNELSFYAIPPGMAASSTPVSITGTLSGGGKSSYVLTALFGAKIYVQNSKTAKVIAVLQPLVGSSTELSGNYVPGTGGMIVTGVNGSSL